MVHMLLAVWFVGWDYGFQVTLFGIPLIVFFSNYIARCLRIRTLPAVPLAIVGMCSYLVAYLQAPAIPEYAANLVDLRDTLQITWGVITFFMIISSMALYTFVAYRSEVRLSSEANHDELTGMPNRHYMSDYLTQLVREADLNDCWLAMIDIDDFKTVNDTYGHTFGDEVLKTVGDAIRASEVGEEACRWGGEEFLLAGRAHGDMKAVEAKLDRLRAAIAEHAIWHESGRVRLTITAGMAVHRTNDTLLEWVNRADAKLYEGKGNGKNQVVCDFGTSHPTG